MVPKVLTAGKSLLEDTVDVSSNLTGDTNMGVSSSTIQKQAMWILLTLIKTHQAMTFVVARCLRSLC